MKGEMSAMESMRKRYFEERCPNCGQRKLVKVEGFRLRCRNCSWRGW